MLVWVRHGYDGLSGMERCSGAYDATDVRVEVCDDCAFAVRDGDVLMACAFDDGKRYVFLRHYTIGK
jgi:hypothetical protein